MFKKTTTVKNKILKPYFIIGSELFLIACFLYWHWFGQVSVHGDVSEIYIPTSVITQDERHDGILHEIVERPTGQFVQLREVLKVGDFVTLPVHQSIYNIDCVTSVWKLQFQQFLEQFISVLWMDRKPGI